MHRDYRQLTVVEADSTQHNAVASVNSILETLSECSVNIWLVCGLLPCCTSLMLLHAYLAHLPVSLATLCTSACSGQTCKLGAGVVDCEVIVQPKGSSDH